MDAKLLEHLVHVRQTAHLAGAIRTLVTDCCTVAPSGALLHVQNMRCGPWVL
jgi:hypothetical protein